MDKKHQRQALAASRALLKVDGIPADVAERFRPYVPDLVDKITIRIQGEVVAFAGPANGRRRRLIHFAVDRAINQFLDILENEPTPVTGVHDLFRRMGYAEAIDAHDLDAMRAAYHIATRDTWEAIRRFVREIDLPTEQFATLIDAILAYVEQLIVQVTVGYLSALQGVERSVHDARRRLLTALFAGRSTEHLEGLADEAGWTPPEQPSVLMASLDAPAYVPNLPKYGSEVLVGLRRQRLTMVAGFEQIQNLAAQLQNMPGVQRVAVSWPLSLCELRDAYLWTGRALDLASMGLIEEEGIIYCARHRALLWLHADPTLSRHASADLLAPLEGEKPHHRLMLAETMLLSLQTRESAPLLAGRMDVHVQTVRHRLRRLKELFGDQLSDPHKTLALLSALELTTPRWRAALRGTRRRGKN